MGMPISRKSVQCPLRKCKDDGDSLGGTGQPRSGSLFLSVGLPLACSIQSFAFCGRCYVYSTPMSITLDFAVSGGCSLSLSLSLCPGVFRIVHGPLAVRAGGSIAGVVRRGTVPVCDITC